MSFVHITIFLWLLHNWNSGDTKTVMRKTYPDFLNLPLFRSSPYSNPTDLDITMSQLRDQKAWAKIDLTHPSFSSWQWQIPYWLWKCASTFFRTLWFLQVGILDKKVNMKSETWIQVLALLWEIQRNSIASPFFLI